MLFHIRQASSFVLNNARIYYIEYCIEFTTVTNIKMKVTIACVIMGLIAICSAAPADKIVR